MVYDAHTGAVARFAQDTRPAVVSHETDRLKGAVIGELLLDGYQTRQFLHKGVCHEIDPIARPFVHSLPGAVLGTAGLSYLITKLPSTKTSNALLRVLIAGEGQNIINNSKGGCS